MAAASVSSLILSDSSVWLFVLFGGCCSNVISLEKYLLINSSTYLLTFVQFLVVTVESFVNLPNKTNFQIPLHRHLMSVTLYFITSTLNNLVFKYQITISVHIIFKSLGTCITMLMGWYFYNKHYSYTKIVSNIILVIGVCIVTLGKQQDQKQADQATDFGVGIALLIISMFTASLMGLYTEVTFLRYGRHWEENLFLIHAVSLPLFFIGYRQLKSEFDTITNHWNAEVLRLLLVNVATQLICVKSVNKLSSQMSSLSLNIVLLMRKFASLMISATLINQEALNYQEVFGCCLVFIGAFSYCLCR